MNYSYSLSLLRQTPGAKFPQCVFSTSITGLDSDRDFIADLEELIEQHQTNLTNAKPVMVTGVNQNVISRYLEDTCDREPANQKYAKPVSANQIFSSATSLAKHLGASSNECSRALSASRRASPPSPYGTVRGVTFGLISDLPPV